MDDDNAWRSAVDEVEANLTKVEAKKVEAEHKKVADAVAENEVEKVEKVEAQEEVEKEEVAKEVEAKKVEAQTKWKLRVTHEANKVATSLLLTCRADSIREKVEATVTGGGATGA